MTEEEFEALPNGSIVESKRHRTIAVVGEFCTRSYRLGSPDPTIRTRRLIPIGGGGTLENMADTGSPIAKNAVLIPETDPRYDDLMRRYVEKQLLGESS